jgi:hypothetical protein
LGRIDFLMGITMKKFATLLVLIGVGISAVGCNNQKAEEAKEKIKNAGESTKKAGENLLEAGKEAAGAAKSGTESLIDSAKEATK